MALKGIKINIVMSCHFPMEDTSLFKGVDGAIKGILFIYFCMAVKTYVDNIYSLLKYGESESYHFSKKYFILKDNIPKPKVDYHLIL